MVAMAEGDVLVFYGGLRPVHPCEHRLIYALLGLYVVEEVVPAVRVPATRWHENAHVRKTARRQTDIVVCASRTFQAGLTAAFRSENGETAPIESAMAFAPMGRVVGKGWIHPTHAVPPTFIRPTRFLDWLESQQVRRIPRNN